MTEIIQVQGDNIEAFMDNVIQKAQEGYTRLDTMELSMAVLTNYWVMTMQREVPETVVEEPKKAGRPAKPKE
jgi:hypothetical protein